MLSVAIKKKLPGGFTLDVEFESDNNTVALLGASGCGKSLTLQCVAGVQRPDLGRIESNGRILFDSAKGINLPPQKRNMGYLFQQYSLFPNMTVAQNIALGVKCKSKRENLDEVERWISSMRLTGLENRRPHQLSGGQRQRVALARALATNPDAMLLDEPFSALDDYLKWQVELELHDTLRDFGGSVVYVSHSRDEVYRLCDSVCVLQSGKSEPQVTVQGLFRSPKSLSASLISGCKNYSRAEKIDDTHVRALDWNIEFTVAAEIPADLQYIGVRAHYIKPRQASDDVNVIPCRITRSIDDVFGAVLMLCPVSADADGESSQLRAEISKPERAALGETEMLEVTVDPADIMLLK